MDKNYLRNSLKESMKVRLNYILACSDEMAATFMEFNKLGVHRLDFCQWFQIKQYLCQKFNVRIKFLEKLKPKIEAFRVL